MNGTNPARRFLTPRWRVGLTEATHYFDRQTSTVVRSKINFNQKGENHEDSANPDVGSLCTRCRWYASGKLDSAGATDRTRTRNLPPTHAPSRLAHMPTRRPKRSRAGPRTSALPRQRFIRRLRGCHRTPMSWTPARRRPDMSAPRLRVPSISCIRMTAPVGNTGQFDSNRNIGGSPINTPVQAAPVRGK